MAQINIKGDLSAAGLDSMISQLRDAISEVQACADVFRNMIANEGKTHAEMLAGGIHVSDNTDHIPGPFNTKVENNTVTIECADKNAAYIEYGTGIIGKLNPHPEPQGWQYDVNEHGVKGWHYGSGRWTNGQIAHSFMHNTLIYLKDNATRLAKEAFDP